MTISDYTDVGSLALGVGGVIFAAWQWKDARRGRVERLAATEQAQQGAQRRAYGLRHQHALSGALTLLDELEEIADAIVIGRELCSHTRLAEMGLKRLADKAEGKARSFPAGDCHLLCRDHDGVAHYADELLARPFPAAAHRGPRVRIQPAGATAVVAAPADAEADLAAAGRAAVAQFAAAQQLRRRIGEARELIRDHLPTV
ncbi:hypothetical protein Cs7R123_63950 [Catellatospora sp. TT07R-123]|uniref:hypothetical protein n=1 Tax=Catellatospora sp. TT07R-123 TaxID=2733863 RepID=UPI001B054058|nr:hypothetical protein [Catellatospora sp. TT07R-123]GHJ49053.1 hypothetical protein Cs7R123_63950 [Catellatospora sp. TT07R-123]